jgi:hypothetical protein
MCSLTFDEVFAILSAVQLSASDLARLREWIASIVDPAECIALTGTPLARLRRKECWLPYLQCVLESRTVRDAARIVGVYRTTSFRWRHRFVPGAMRDRPAKLTAIVEADETFRLRFRGVGAAT